MSTCHTLQDLHSLNILHRDRSVWERWTSFKRMCFFLILSPWKLWFCNVLQGFKDDSAKHDIYVSGKHWVWRGKYDYRMKYFDWSPVHGMQCSQMKTNSLECLFMCFFSLQNREEAYLQTLYTQLVYVEVMLKWSISSIVFLSCLKDHLFQKSSFKNRGLNVEHPGKRRFDVIRKGRLHIETPVSFLDLSGWRLVNDMFISLIMLLTFAFGGGRWNSPHNFTLSPHSRPQDIKPSNLLLDDGDLRNLRITDFGPGGWEGRLLLSERTDHSN